MPQSKKYMVRRDDGAFLSSPWGQPGDGSGLDTIRWWTRNEEDAHHFNSRKEAKEALTRANDPINNVSFLPLKVAA